MTLKLAIVSDTHFGHPRWGEDARLQGASAMLSASKEADALLLPGDIFDNPTPSFNVLSEFVSVLRQIKIPILAIHGTHELRPKGFLNPIQLLNTAGLLIDIHRNPQDFSFQNQQVSITGLGGVPEEFFLPALKKADFKPKEGSFNIFIFHQSLSEFIFSKAQEFASFEDLPPGFDLYICGHVHKGREAFGGKLLLPGSTVMTQMKEEEEGEKCYVIYDTLSKKAEYKPIKSRPFHFLSLPFQSASPQKISKKLEEEIFSIVSKEKEKPIIKIKLEGSMQDGLLNSDFIPPKTDSCFLFIDNCLESKTLSQKIEHLRQIREKKLSVQDFGLELLSGHLKQGGLEAENLKELFEKLSEGEETDISTYLKKHSQSPGKEKKSP